MDNTTKLELKNQALLERVSELTTTYENRVADLRVEVTMLSQKSQNDDAEIERLRNELVQHQEEATISANERSEASTD